MDIVRISATGAGVNYFPEFVARELGFFADEGLDVTVEVLGNAELAQVVSVLRERRSDDRGTGAGGELDGEAADAAGRADDQNRFSLGERERVDGRECGDASERGDAGRGEVERGGFRRDLHLRGECDQLGPASLVDGGIRVQEEAEDLVTHRITLEVRAECFDGARVVTAEDNRKVVVDHFPQHPGHDRVVDGVGLGPAHAHNHAAGRHCRIGQVVAHGRSGVEGIEGDGSHQDLLSCWRPEYAVALRAGAQA